MFSSEIVFRSPSKFTYSVHITFPLKNLSQRWQQMQTLPWGSVLPRVTEVHAGFQMMKRSVSVACIPLCLQLSVRKLILQNIYCKLFVTGEWTSLSAFISTTLDIISVLQHIYICIPKYKDPLSKELDELDDYEGSLQTSSGHQISGNTPELHLAARRSDLEAVKFLTDKEHQKPVSVSDHWHCTGTVSSRSSGQGLWTPHR